jgi:cellulose biosynthesis protein BcsQ
LEEIEDNKLISVCSFKGGTGKTSISINLAKVASEYKIETLLWEIDKNPGSLSSIFDLDPFANVVSAIMNPQGFHYYINHIKNEKFDILLGPPDPIIGEEIDDIKKLSSIINLAKNSYKLIIFDLGPYLDKISIQLMNESDLILLIIEPEVSSISKARANIDLICKKTEYEIENKIWAVVNKIEVFDNVTISQIIDALKLPFCTKIAYDITYRSQMNRIESKIPKTKLYNGCKKIFKKIYPEAKRPKKRKAIFKKDKKDIKDIKN